MRTNKATGRATEARRTAVADLIHQKLTIRQIAARTGVAVSTAHADVTAVRAEWGSYRDAELSEHVAEMLALLDALHQAVWLPALAGDLEAMDRVLSIMDRRARLLGLYAPVQIDITAEIRALATSIGLDPDEALELMERDQAARPAASGLIRPPHRLTAPPPVAKPRLLPPAATS